MWSAVQAQQPPDPAELQRMMAQAQALQACLAKTDQGALDALRRKGEAIAAELKAMCAAGQREAAQARAIEYGREMAAAPIMKSLAACGDMAKSLVQLPFVAEETGGQTPQVCDTGL
jgi:hypothetical protein